ncbi:hypothetical protein LINPERHAP1_LOCUS34513, partial [Linum perenne]
MGKGLAWVCILLRNYEKMQLQNWQDMDDNQFQVLKVRSINSTIKNHLQHTL